MNKRPNFFAAVVATVIVFLALSPLLNGALQLYAHFPPWPEWTVVVIWLGTPGMLIANAIAGYSERSSLTVAIAATWVFYFLLFRFIASWPRYRQWMRRRAVQYVKKSEREKRQRE
jgi:hypothetical protein